jgi:hypothetical protein
VDCQRFLRQVASAPLQKELMQRREVLQAQYRAAEFAAEDFVLIGHLGVKLEALQRESAQLPLSEEDYLALADRHAQLVQRVTDKCKELTKGRQFDELAALGIQLKALKAVDVSNFSSQVTSGECTRPVRFNAVFIILTHLSHSFGACQAAGTLVDDSGWSAQGDRFSTFGGWEAEGGDKTAADSWNTFAAAAGKLRRLRCPLKCSCFDAPVQMSALFRSRHADRRQQLGRIFRSNTGRRLLQRAYAGSDLPLF